MFKAFFDNKSVSMASPSKWRELFRKTNVRLYIVCQGKTSVWCRNDNMLFPRSHNCVIYCRLELDNYVTLQLSKLNEKQSSGFRFGLNRERQRRCCII